MDLNIPLGKLIKLRDALLPDKKSDERNVSSGELYEVLRRTGVYDFLRRGMADIDNHGEGFDVPLPSYNGERTRLVIKSMGFGFDSHMYFVSRRNCPGSV
ncbi:hypothetical protein COU59_03630 [Candidatus Pacearchaeota archaeon CG10_big_fil_rev_8_21_14_0_10_34_12]|nr:MAG: hypothetical protein COU59_03630 [Candidatus Pacearchaeota archaeon CG10_big_fil_rev_8_21_14_0_10_34_12]